MSQTESVMHKFFKSFQILKAFPYEVIWLWTSTAELCYLKASLANSAIKLKMSEQTVFFYAVVSASVSDLWHYTCWLHMLLIVISRKWLQVKLSICFVYGVPSCPSLPSVPMMSYYAEYLNMKWRQSSCNSAGGHSQTTDTSCNVYCNV
jgi:hypothetical protein